MSKKRNTRDFEELLLKDVLMELEVGDDETWEQLAAECASFPGHAPTPQQQAAFEKQLDLEVKRIQNEKRQNSQMQQIQRLRHQKRMRALRRVAMVVAFLAVFTGFFLFDSVEAFAGGIDRFIATVVPEEGAEELRVEEKKDGGVELNFEDFTGMFFPNWMPRGYYMDGVECYEHQNKVIYKNKNGETIVYEVARKVNSVFLDDEDVVESTIYILDTQGHIIKTEDSIYIVWEDEMYVYTVSGDIELEKQIKEMAVRCIKIE